MEEIGKMLLLFGAMLSLVGGSLLLIGKLLGLGRLPGDIVLQTDKGACFIPIATSILLSIVLTLLLNLFLRVFMK